MPMFGVGEDRYTNTVEDAAAWEAARSWGSYDDGRPSRAEAEEDARLDRIAAKRQQEADDAARARGEYVPSSGTRLTASLLSLTLAQGGLYGLDVRPHREGVFRIAGVSDAEHPAFDRIDREMFEVRVVDGVVWMKGTYPDPWAADGPLGEPPF